MAGLLLGGEDKIYAKVANSEKNLLVSRSEK